MSKRDDIIKIWQESFKDPRAYVAMYFDRVYRDDEGLTLTDDQGLTVSSLLLQHYAISYQGQQLPVSYVAGAATRRNQRGKGYMSTLMTEALRASVERGDALCTLIPAHSALYFYYQRFGFSTVFYTKEQRFTSAHLFPGEGDFYPVTDATSEDVWDAFNRFQGMRSCYVVHSRRDFDNILTDLEYDKGDFVVMAANDEDSGPRIVSMAWAVKQDDLLLVKDLMGETEEARKAAMRELRRLHPGVPFLLYGRPTDNKGGRLMPRGMARVVNAQLMLEAVAEANPKFRCAMRVTDHIMPEVNSHTYVIANGGCQVTDDYAGKLDFDVTIDVLADILFSSPAIGEILRFPSVRPMISLMLD